MTENERNTLLNEQHTIVLNAKNKLRDYSYIGTEIAMGVATKEDYAAEIAETEHWCEEIRKANKRIKELEDTEVESDESPAE